MFPSARGAFAQTVTGHIVASTDRSAVSGAIVALLDTTGRVVVSGLAEADGAFRLDAPRSGRYSVRVDRVGFRSSTSAPVLVADGETVDVPIAIASEGISLLAVRVSADRRCVVRPQEGLAAAQLWDEARKALSATQLTQLAQAAAHARRDPHRFLIRARKFERQLTPVSLKPFHEEEFQVEAETFAPFVSRDPELLDRDGYMSGSMETGSILYAPDAAILLSDRFLDSHCFRVEEFHRSDRSDLIGLGFEPARLTRRGRDRPPRVDVSGVLWLDRSSAELRYMEYHYVDLPVEVPNEAAGGLLEFRPLPDGRWIVWRWYVRTPELQRRQSFTNPLPYATGESHLELKSIHEEGAEIIGVLPPGSRLPSMAVLQGTVFDSLRGAPLAGARVFLSGTSFAAVSNADGSYTVDAIPPGKYSVSVLTPRLDSLLLDAPAHELALSAGEQRRLDFAVPSVHGLSSRLCSGVDAPDSTAMLIGVVRDTSGSTATGASVRAEWQSFAKAAADRLTARTQISETRAVGGGRFALCGLPPDTRLTVTARRGGNNAASPVLHLAPGEVRRVDLRLRTP